MVYPKEGYCRVQWSYEIKGNAREAGESEKEELKELKKAKSKESN